MIFSSIFFLFFYLPIVILIYFTSPHKFRNLVLFIVSLIFYGWGEPIYIGIMIYSTLVDYFNGLMIKKHRDDQKKARFFLILSIIANLGVLGFFKYYDFFVLNINSLFNSELLTPMNLALPIGISFYTFQTMSYTIDVYRGEVEAQKNLVNFGAFVTLFPQLVAGPIVRYIDISNELNHRKETMDDIAYGIRRFIIGVGKKVLLANSIGMLWDEIKMIPTAALSTELAWLGIIAFAFQIYFDFSGYSDMAIGLGRIFGFKFLENFNYPYISKSITEFWRRWHISLGTWFREYVYIPLGGNRCGLKKQLRNIIIVWFLTGFWHGANWNFMFWGLYFAIILIIEKTFLLKYLEKLPSIISHLYAIVLILVGWVLFAIEDLDLVFSYLGVMFNFNLIATQMNTFLYYLNNYGILLILLIIASLPLPKMIYNKLSSYKGLDFIIPIYYLFIFILSTAYLVDASYNPFLYFRF